MLSKTLCRGWVRTKLGTIRHLSKSAARQKSCKPLREKKKSGAPGEIRTPDLLLRRQSLYPSELRAPSSVYMGGLRCINVRICAGVQASDRESARSCENHLPRRLKSELLVATASAAATAASAAVAAAITASASTVASAASGMLGFRARLVHVECASAHLRTVQRRDGLFSIFVTGHFHKAESARAPVSRSVMMLTRSTCPNGSNIVRSSSSDVLKLKFPTKIFFTHLPLH